MPIGRMFRQNMPDSFPGAARGNRKARRLRLATVTALLMTAADAGAGEHLAGFGRVSEPLSPTPLEEWGPVPTDQASLANLAPGLLPFFNNGPVFGLPGTVTENFWDQTQLTGDRGYPNRDDPPRAVH
jgi:hypothetical protein